MNVIKNIIIILLILGCVGIIGNCGYRIYDKLNGGDTSTPNNTEENNNVVENDSKNADMNKSLLLNLYDNGIIKSMNIREVIKEDVDFTLDYGIVGGHNLKIKICIKDTGKTVQTDPDLKIYKQEFDVYVDNEKYNLFDKEKAYMYTVGIGELLENIEIKANKIGIIIINRRQFDVNDVETKPFVLIYSNKFEYIDNITTQYSLNSYNPNNLIMTPVEVYDDYITYCKYNEEMEKNNWQIGYNEVKYVKYDGNKEEIYKEEKNVYLHYQTT